MHPCRSSWYSFQVWPLSRFCFDRFPIIHLFQHLHPSLPAVLSNDPNLPAPRQAFLRRVVYHSSLFLLKLLLRFSFYSAFHKHFDMRNSYQFHADSFNMFLSLCILQFFCFFADIFYCTYSFYILHNQYQIRDSRIQKIRALYVNDYDRAVFSAGRRFRSLYHDRWFSFLLRHISVLKEHSSLLSVEVITDKKQNGTMPQAKAE